MKKLIVIATLMILGIPTVKAETPGVTGREDGVGAGGSGGNPNAHTAGTSSVRPGTMGLMGFGISSVEGVKTPTATVTAGTPKSESTITVNREELLKAVDAALNSTDIEMEVNEKPITVRLKNFDLTRGILHGQILETNKAIRLIDEAKAGSK